MGVKSPDKRRFARFAEDIPPGPILLAPTTRHVEQLTGALYKRLRSDPRKEQPLK